MKSIYPKARISRCRVYDNKWTIVVWLKKEQTFGQYLLKDGSFSDIRPTSMLSNSSREAIGVLKEYYKCKKYKCEAVFASRHNEAYMHELIRK